MILLLVSNYFIGHNQWLEPLGFKFIFEVFPEKLISSNEATC